MFLTFLFRSAPEEGLYCKPKYRANFFFFLKNKYISVILAFVVCSIKLVTSAVGISLPLIFCIIVRYFGNVTVSLFVLERFDDPKQKGCRGCLGQDGANYSLVSVTCVGTDLVTLPS